MKFVQLSIALFSFMAAPTLNASAEIKEEINFQFDHKVSIERNYANFKRKAKRACRSTPYFYPYNLTVKCRQELMDQAVKAINLEEFSAFHRGNAPSHAMTIASR